MTIYEGLGINDVLIDVEIPKDTILDNISTSLYFEAKQIFC